MLGMDEFPVDENLFEDDEAGETLLSSKTDEAPSAAAEEEPAQMLSALADDCVSLASLSCSQCIHILHVLGCRNIEDIFANRNINGEDLSYVESLQDFEDLKTTLPTIQLKKVLQNIMEWKKKGVPKAMFEQEVDLEASRRAARALQAAQEALQPALSTVQHVLVGDHAARNTRKATAPKPTTATIIKERSHSSSRTTNTTATTTSSDNEEATVGRKRGRHSSVSASSSSATPVAVSNSLGVANKAPKTSSKAPVMQTESAISFLQNMAKSTNVQQQQSFLSHLLETQYNNKQLNVSLGQANAVHILFVAIDFFDQQASVGLLASLFDVMALLLCCWDDLTLYLPSTLRDFVHEQGFDRVYAIFLKYPTHADIVRSSWKILKLMGIYKHCEVQLRKQHCWVELVKMIFQFHRNVFVLEELVHALANGCIRKENRDVILQQRGAISNGAGASSSSRNNSPVDMDICELLTTHLLPSFHPQQMLCYKLSLAINKLITEATMVKHFRSVASCQLVLQSMRLHQSNAEVLQSLAWIVTNLTYDDESSQCLLKLTQPQDILTFLIGILLQFLTPSNPPTGSVGNVGELLMVVLRALINLSCTEEVCNKLTKTKLCEAIICVLQKYIASSTELHVLEECCHLMVNIGHHDLHRQRLGMLGGCEYLVRILQSYSQHVTLVSYTTRAITNLTNSAENQAKIGKCGGCEAVLSILRSMPKDAILLERLCRSIANLSQDEVNQDYFRKEKAVSTLLAVIKKHVNNGGIVEEACCGLALLCTTPAALSEVTEQQKAPEISKFFLKVFKSYRKNPDAVFQLLRVVINFCDDPTLLDCLVAHGLVELTMEVLPWHREESHVVEYITQLLVILSGINFDTALYLKQSLPALLALMQQPAAATATDLSNEPPQPQHPLHAVVEDVCKVVINLAWHEELRILLTNEAVLWTVLLANISQAMAQLPKGDNHTTLVLDKLCDVVESLGIPSQFKLSSTLPSSSTDGTDSAALKDIFDKLMQAICYFSEVGQEDSTMVVRLLNLFTTLVEWGDNPNAAAVDNLRPVFAQFEEGMHIWYTVLKRFITDINVVASLLPCFHSVLTFQQSTAECVAQTKGYAVLLVQVLNIHHQHLRRYAIPLIDSLGILMKHPANLRQFRKTGLKEFLSKYQTRTEIVECNLVTHVEELLCILDSESSEHDEEPDDIAQADQEGEDGDGKPRRGRKKTRA